MFAFLQKAMGSHGRLWGGDIVRTLNGQVPIFASISHDARLSQALV